MKKILLFAVITAFLLISCNEELITVVDEYNAPYDVQAIPGNNKVSITFWSGIIASDFAGFNIYAGASPNLVQTNDAIKNSNGILPTILGSNHIRTNYTIEIPNYTFNNNTLYYISVTAYGTNNLVDKKYIETPINYILPVIPRQEGTGNGNTLTAGGQNVGNINNNIITANSNWLVQYFGYQTNFNAVIIITNTNDSYFDSNAVYSKNGLYIFKNGNQLVKILMQNNSYRWAYQPNASQWWGI